MLRIFELTPLSGTCTMKVGDLNLQNQISRYCIKIFKTNGSGNAPESSETSKLF
jgi:hypothetical protein